VGGEAAAQWRGVAEKRNFQEGPWIGRVANQKVFQGS